MGYKPYTEEEIKKHSEIVQKGIDEDNKKQEEKARLLKKIEEREKAEKGASGGSSSAEPESLGKEDFSLSETSETSQSMTEVVDASPNVTPPAETKSDENRLGYIAILLILAMIFIVCLQRFLSERKVEKECDGISRHKRYCERK